MGTFIREKYYNFISKNGGFNGNNIYIKSTAAKRCIDSAQSNLQGLFASKRPPIKVQFDPYEEDYILAQRKPCPRYTQEMKRVNESMKPINEANAELFKILSEKTGMNVNRVCSVLSLYDNIFSNEQHKNP